MDDISYDLFNSLNNKQKEAVTAPLDNLVVLAGAGSGKTRVLVYRIAWLLSVENCSPNSILAVTFTNKAAVEIRNRIKQLTYTTDGIWIGTFHGLAHRLLRVHYMDANLPRDFQILDSDDQQRLLKRLMYAYNINDKEWTPRQAIWYICAQKDAGLRPQNIEIKGYNPVEATLKRIYHIYQETCDRAGLVDFSELLLRAYELWLNKPYILAQYRARFKNILVDEFQDTNKIQYAWIYMLAINQGKVMVVGDDDQSIYGWRGAQVENIQHFLEDFPDAKTIYLEQNYRSTSNILKAANALICNNSDRLGKKSLWTEGPEGELIALYRAFNELDEAHFIAKRIKMLQEKGYALHDCAILYRSNAQSRVLEDALVKMNLPYKIYGGMRFFDRKEIRDALSYLRLIANRDDDTAFERVVNTPPRGIGNRTLNMIRKTARDLHLPFWKTTILLLTEKRLVGRVTHALQQFIELVDTLAQDTAELSLYDQTDFVIKKSGLWMMYEQEKGQNNQIRIDNLKELVTATRQYNSEDLMLLPLQEFLSHTVLEEINNQSDYYQDTVQMMTLHSAKGLEFPQVFIVGMEEGMFPSQMSLDAGGKRLEEERRLAYVGITRAMEKLTITFASSRRLYGKEVSYKPSRFIKELPQQYIEKEENVVDRLQQQKQRLGMFFDDRVFILGQRVRHPKFGDGTVLNLEGSGKSKRLKICFSKNVIKWIMVAYARLESCSNK